MELGWIIALSTLGGLVVLALILTILFLAARARPQAGLGPTFDPTRTRPPRGRWNAQILADTTFGAMGGSLGATDGVFEVVDGRLLFFAEGSPSATWAIPCVEVNARAHGTFSTAGTILWWRDRQFRCNVSREHINSWAENDFKKYRQTRYAREFVHVLCANGARQV